MSVNRRQPHVLVIPEDDANRQLAIGFELALDWSVQRKFQVLPPVGGWTKVLDCFKADHLVDMARYPQRFVVLLIDFDGTPDTRLNHTRTAIPDELIDRVFILGTRSHPEALKQANLGTYEVIGKRLAQDCRDGTDTAWGHDLLQHNAAELGRLREHVGPILFA